MLFSSQDMIHIADTKVARRYGDFFIRQIHKFEEVRPEQESCVGGWGEHWKLWAVQPLEEPHLCDTAA